MTHLSEARQDLYNKVFAHMKGKDASMSIFSQKHGYHAGETEALAPVEWEVAKVGYLDEITVRYLTATGQIETFREQCPDNWTERTLAEMLAHRSITYPE